MIPPVVVELDEGPDGRFQIPHHLVGYLVNVVLQGSVISLQFAVGLRVIGCCQEVTNAHQVQIFPEGLDI